MVERRLFCDDVSVVLVTHECDVTLEAHIYGTEQEESSIFFLTSV